MMAFTTICLNCKTQRTLYFELSTSQASNGLTGAAWMLLSTVVSSCAVHVKLSLSCAVYVKLSSSCAVYVKLSSSCPPGTSFWPFTAKASGASGSGCCPRPLWQIELTESCGRQFLVDWENISMRHDVIKKREIGSTLNSYHFRRGLLEQPHQQVVVPQAMAHMLTSLEALQSIHYPLLPCDVLFWMTYMEVSCRRPKKQVLSDAD